MPYDVIADYANHCGEGPLWHAAEKKLYWCDIPTGRLFRYDPAKKTHEQVYTDRTVGGFTIQADGSLLLFRDKGNVVTWRDGAVQKTIIDSVPELLDTRFNDVVAAPDGTVFCGTMSSKTIKGRLHRLHRDGRLEVLLTDQGTPNGMGFTPDLSKMYYNDSGKAVTWLFDYDRTTGQLSQQRVFNDATTSGDPGRPDGLVVDGKGHVWIARWEGSCVIEFSPDGKKLREIAIGARNVTSLIFGGDKLDQMFVTSAGGDKKNDPQHGPTAGATFLVTGHGTTGQTEFLSRIGL